MLKTIILLDFYNLFLHNKKVNCITLQKDFLPSDAASLSKVNPIADFTQLPLDIWTIIDTYLPFRDRIALRTAWKGARSPEMLASAFAYSYGVSRIVCNILKKSQNPNTLLQSATLATIKDKVTKLDLKNANLSTDTFGTILHMFSRLQSLDVRNTKITADKLNQLAQFSHFKELFLPEITLKPATKTAFTAIFTNMTNLETVAFDRDDSWMLTEEYLVAEDRQIFSSLPTQLKRLTLNSCSITDEHLLALSGLTRLEDFRIHHPGNFFRGSGLDCLPLSVTRLHVTSCQCDQRDTLTSLQRLSSLQVLNIRNTGKDLTFSALPHSVTALHADRCRQKNIESLSTLTELKEFSLSAVRGAIRTLRPLPKSLQILSLRYMFDYKISKLGLQELTNLRSLDISDSKIDSTTIDTLPPGINKLTCTESCAPMLSQLTKLTKLHELQLTWSNSMLESVQLQQLPMSLRSVTLTVIDSSDSTSFFATKIRELPHLLLQEIESFQIQRQHCQMKLETRSGSDRGQDRGQA